MAKHRREMVPIAVVGVSALFPGSTDARGFWADILAGRDLITDVPPTHWLVEDYYDPDPTALDKTYCKRGAFLPSLNFDPVEFGVPPSIMPMTDSSQILALIVAQQVLEDASQGQFASMDRERISVVLGVTSGQQLLGSMVSRLQRPIWLKALRESGIPEDEAQAICGRIAKHYVPWHESSFPGLLGNVVAGRIANRFDLRGTNAVADAACASSMAAVSMAINELALGQSDLAITGGVDTMNDIFMYVCFSKTPALSASGDCRPFSAAADGTLLGEGLGMLALKRLSDAESDGDRIYAVIRGLGTSSDGRGTSVYAPSQRGQALALRRAYRAADYGPETVELVEAHGTGTKAGDLAEFEALRATFAESGRSDMQWCALGSIKSQIGHTKAAAGTAGLFKAIMALHHKVLPPTIKVEQPNPALEIENSGFYLNTQARPWIRDGAHPRRASVSSFGFGGSNFHVTLEEYAAVKQKGRHAWRLRTMPAELVLLSAGSAPELIAQCRSLAGKPGDLTNVARESQQRFRIADGCRLAVVASSATDLAARLAQVEAAIANSPDLGFVTPTGASYATGEASPGQVAFLFSGQGSQYVGMGSDLAMSLDPARAAWDATAGLSFDGERIYNVVFPRPAFSDDLRVAQASKLTATEWAQPAIGVFSLAMINVLRAAGVRPQCVAGHSFGEVVALHCAGAFDQATLVKIARRRGELMRDASSSSGAMTAVQCSIDDARAVLDGLGGVVVANHNAPSQCVLSGNVEAIARVETAFTARKIATTRLNVAAAFHSRLVASSSPPFHSYLKQLDITAPGIDVYGCADAAPYPQDPDAIRKRLAEQITHPVHFLDQVEAMYAAGARVFIEAGPGKVLTELVGRILCGRPHLAVNLDQHGSHGITTLQIALGRLAVAGIAIDPGFLWTHYAMPSDKPGKKAAMAIAVSGVNYGKPYPPAGGTSDLPAPNPPRRHAIEAAPPVAPAAAGEGRPRIEGPGPERLPAAIDSHSAWIQAYQEMQRQTAEAHAAYQRAMAETHLAFLKTAEASFSGLSALLGGENRSVADPVSLGTAPPDFAQGQAAAASPVPHESSAPATDSAHAIRGEDPGPAPSAPTMEPSRLLLPHEAAPSPDGAVDLEALLIEIIAEKTGYPREMLASHMDLESDLGVDSIKRVEILSAMGERAQAVRDVKMMEFATLRTIGQIVEHMRTQSAEGSHSPVRATISPYASGIEPASAGAIGSMIRQGIERFVIRTADAPALGMAVAGIYTADCVFITDDGAGLAGELAKQFARRGVLARVVREVPPKANAVIFLGGMRPVASVDEAIAVNREAFHAARVVAARFSLETGGVFVTVQDTGGDFGLRGSDETRAWLGGISALARTAAIEWPDASVKAIDCEGGGRHPAELADAICMELFEAGPALEVGLRADGRRITPVRAAAVARPAALPPIGPQSVVVASGGARGVTAASLVALARAHQPRIVLLGRTPIESALEAAGAGNGDLGVNGMPDGLTKARKMMQTEATARRVREIRATLEALAAAGSPTRYIEADVQDGAAVASALDAVRREWGPITAIVHGAGVLSDKRIADKTSEQFDHVFDTKVKGLRALLAATAQDPLKAVCLFSSAAARFGNAGQCDYAMANEVLNLVACATRARLGEECTVRSIGWGPWDGGMVTPGLKTHFEQKGVTLIPLELGAKMFVEEVNSAGDDVLLTVGSANNLGAVASPRVSAEVHVNGLSHAYLDDHRINGTPVLPVVIAVEWILRSASACRPDLAFTAVKNVRVLNGIKLDQFHQAGDVFTVNCRQTRAADKVEIAVELRARDGTLHYNAIVEMAACVPVAPPPPTPPELDGWNHSEIYDGRVLFHRARFQVIRSVDGVSRAGIAGTLIGAHKIGWPRDAKCTDPAVLDGGLQLAGLWTRHVLGATNLPMGFGELRAYRQGPVEGLVRCMVHAGHIQDMRTVCDVRFVDQSGSLIAEMLGVEMVLRPEEVFGAKAAGGYLT